MIKIENIKARKQLKSWSCGVASLRTIFLYYGLNISEDELIKIGNIKDDGTSHQQMRKMSKKYKFKMYSKSNASVEDLEKWINRGHPVIVNYQDWGNYDNGLNGHYSVLYGYDKKYFYLADPSNYLEGDGKKFTNNKKMIRKNFIKRWWDIEENFDESKKWFAVIRPQV